LFATPAVIFGIWFLYSENVDVKDGSYSCEPATSLPTAGLFWTATIENGELVDVEWAGPGEREVTGFELGENDGADEFIASVDGTQVTCS
jgi:hypothetical protein